MKLGLVAPTERRATHDQIRKVAVTAEELGVSTLWVGDHLVFPQEYESSYPYGSEIYVDDDRFFMESLTSLAFIAGATRKIGLGTDVLIAPLRRPLALANVVGTLWYLSGGRLHLGVGAGWLREEFDLIGADFDSRYEQLEGFISLVRKLSETKGRMTENDGSGYFAVPFESEARSAPDILYGGTSEGACKRAVRIADGWVGVGLSLNGLRERLDWFSQYAESFGRDLGDFRIITSGLVDLVEDRTSWDDDSRVLRGSAEAIVEHLHAYSALGVDEFIAYPRAGREDGWLQRYISVVERVTEAARPPLVLSSFRSA